MWQDWAGFHLRLIVYGDTPALEDGLASGAEPMVQLWGGVAARRFIVGGNYGCTGLHTARPLPPVTLCLRCQFRTGSSESEGVSSLSNVRAATGTFHNRPALL